MNVAAMETSESVDKACCLMLVSFYHLRDIHRQGCLSSFSRFHRGKRVFFESRSDMLVCVCVFLLAGQRSQTTCARRIRRLPRCRGRDALSIRQQASQGTARRARHLRSPLHNPTQQPMMTRIQCGVDNKCSSTAKSKSSFLWKKDKSSSRDLRQLPWRVAHKKGGAASPAISHSR